MKKNGIMTYMEIVYRKLENAFTRKLSEDLDCSDSLDLMPKILHCSEVDDAASFIGLEKRFLLKNFFLPDVF